MMMCMDKSFIMNTAVFLKKIGIVHFDFMVTLMSYKIITINLAYKVIVLIGVVIFHHPFYFIL